MIPPLHVVTNDRIFARPDFGSVAREVLRVGGEALALHVRGPRSSGRRVYERARTLHAAARDAGATLLVNDRVDVALVLKLDGVHLGQRSLPPDRARRILGPEALVGVSVHDAEEARAARSGGADYLFVGTIFRSPTHPDRPAAGPELVRRIASCGAPSIAIGGIVPERVREVREAGAHGIAVVSGVWDAGNPAGVVRAYLRSIRSAST